MPRVEHPDAERLGQAERQSGPRGVLAQQAVRVGDAGDGHAVSGSGASMVWPPATGSRPRGHLRTAAQHLGEQVERSTSRGQPTRFIARTRLAAHGADVGQGVGGRDAAPVEGSSTTGVKKSAVLTTARSPSSRPPPRRRRSSAPTSRSGVPRAGRRPAGAPRARPAGILQAHPPPAAYWVIRTAMPPPSQVPRASLAGGGVQAPGGPPGLQHR